MSKNEFLKTMWIASAIAAVFTDSGVLCLLPATFITFVAMTSN